jgi:hypothetical protein
MKMIERWRELLTKVEVATGIVPMSESEVKAFEEHLSFKLPIGCKEYLQVFGRGEFGNGFIEMLCSDTESSVMNIVFYRDAVKGMENYVDLQDLSSYNNLLEELREFNSLLDRAYMFADSSRKESYVWDLSTYNETDSSYDIYQIRFGSSDKFLVIAQPR